MIWLAGQAGQQHSAIITDGELYSYKENNQKTNVAHRKLRQAELYHSSEQRQQAQSCGNIIQSWR